MERSLAISAGMHKAILRKQFAEARRQAKEQTDFDDAIDAAREAAQRLLIGPIE